MNPWILIIIVQAGQMYKTEAMVATTARFSSRVSCEKAATAIQTSNKIMLVFAQCFEDKKK